MAMFDTIINAALANAVRLPDFTGEATLILGQHQIKALRVVAKTDRQDYVNNLFEEIICTIAISAEEYSRIILNAHEDMYMVLSQMPFDGGRKITTRWRAVLTSVSDPSIEANQQFSTQPSEAGKTNISIISFQLLDPAAYNLRLLKVGNTFRNETAINALRYFLSKNTLTNSMGTKDAVSSIVVAPGALTKKHSVVVVDDGTPLSSLPDWLQDKYGVYNQGLGMFLKDRIWYVFAPYAVSQRTDDVSRLVVINAPAGRYRNLEKTFSIVGKTVTIIATGEAKHKRTSDTDALNYGTGVVYASADKLLDGMTDTSGNPVMTPEKYMVEYRSSRYRNPDDNFHVPKDKFVSNPAIYATHLAAAGGDIISIDWENGFATPLKPGMPVTFISPYKDGIRKYTGTLLGVEEHTSVPLGGLVETRYNTNVKLTMFLKESEVVTVKK